MTSCGQGLVFYYTLPLGTPLERNGPCLMISMCDVLDVFYLPYVWNYWQVKYLFCAKNAMAVFKIGGFPVSSARNKDQKLVGHFLKIWYLINYCSIKNVQEIWPTIMVGKRPMADLFLALLSVLYGKKPVPAV